MTRVHFARVSKRYRIGSRLPSLREALSGVLSGNDDERRHHWALKDVSFELAGGESLAVLGPNGAGKTTILRILSRVTSATGGTVRVDGKLSALLELGAGFHPELTGRENVYLNGTLLGLRRAEIRDRFERIREFAGIDEYLDTPVKRYSSGMYVRLGFAVAAHVDAEVLLVDEVLAVGDYAFRERCYAHLDELRRRGTSIILVSHDMEAVRRVCERGMVIYGGEKVFAGSVSEAVLGYSEIMRAAARRARAVVPTVGGLAARVMTFDAEIERVELLDDKDVPARVLASGAGATVAVDVVFHRPVVDPVFALTVRTPDGRTVYDTTSRWLGVRAPDGSAGERRRARFRIRLPLLAGIYQIGVDVAAADLSHYYDRLERALDFSVEGTPAAKGIVDLAAEVSFDTPGALGRDPKT